MDKLNFPKTDLLLQEIWAFRERELLVECWEVFWRKLDTRLIDEYFMDNHVNELENRINRISGIFYYAAKDELLSFIMAAPNDFTRIRKLKIELFENIQTLQRGFSREALTNHISELNQDAPLLISGRFDTEDEEEWIVTNKHEIIDPVFIKDFIILLRPAILPLENLLLMVTLSDKPGGAEELTTILSGSEIFVSIEETLPDLLKNKEDINLIDEFLLDGGFIELHSNTSQCKYIWLGFNNNEEMQVESSINSSSIEQFEKNKVRTFSPIYQLAGLAYWLYEKRKLKSDIHIGSRLGRAVLIYYNKATTKSNEKAFQKNNQKNFGLYTDYFEDLKDKLK